MSESFFKPASLALAFLFELGALAALAYWGFETGQGWAARIIFGLGAPVLAAVFWGTFLSPKAAVRLPEAVTYALKAVVFGCAALALAVAGPVWWAWLLGLVAALNLLLALNRLALRLWGR